jgi:hypothetical protein
MYGLWDSELGDSDPDGYSNKLFDGNDVLFYGDTIVMDELNKKSGYDGNFTVETIQITNMWMAMITELYRAVQLCGEGKEALMYFDTKFNPVDFAAALWFGTAQDANSIDGRSLYEWTKRAGLAFANRNVVSVLITRQLSFLQAAFSKCADLYSEEESNQNRIAMKHMVDELTRMMIVPLVQNFIHHLAVEVGMRDRTHRSCALSLLEHSLLSLMIPRSLVHCASFTTKSGITNQATTDERNHMVLYALAVLPLLSVCDKSTTDELFTDLVIGTENAVTLNASTFLDHIGKLQAKYHCLGISCDMGEHPRTFAEKITSFNDFCRSRAVIFCLFP